MFVNKEFLFVFSNIAYFHHCLCNVQTCGALWRNIWLIGA